MASSIELVNIFMYSIVRFPETKPLDLSIKFFFANLVSVAQRLDEIHLGSHQHQRVDASITKMRLAKPADRPPA